MKNRSWLAAIALALPGLLFPRDARAQTTVINSLSATTLAQAGRLVIQGSNLGARLGNGKVTIGGASSPISSWTDNAITLYVPDASPLSADLGKVTSGRASDALTLNVTARPATTDRIRWRFQTAGLYIQGRPGVGPDGTVYALDVDGHLYALTSAGGLKWIFNTAATAVQSVDVGADGTVYIASAGNTIYAVNPDGTLKWQVSDPSGEAVEAGPNVGSDGNIYAATEDSGIANGLGAITISPAGQILSNRAGYLAGRGRDFLTREIVFGAPNRFYFVLNNIDNNSGLQFFQLGGSFLFVRSAGGSDEQPDVDAAGNIYSNIDSTQIGVFDVNGNLLRSTFFTGALSAPNLGADGTIYQAESFPTNLRALNPDLAGARSHFSGSMFPRPRAPGSRPENSRVTPTDSMCS